MAQNYCRERKQKMRVNKIFRVMIMILILAIIIMVSFVGIFAKDNNRLINIVAGYQFGMNLGEQQELVLAPSKEMVTNYYDKDGNLVDSWNVTEENKSEYTEKEETVNASELLTVENFKAAKEIVSKRLASFKLSEYTISLDENTGNIVIRTLESENLNARMAAIYPLR